MNASTWIRAALVGCLLATLPAVARQPPLPLDSVYQLDVELADCDVRNRAAVRVKNALLRHVSSSL